MFTTSYKYIISIVATLAVASSLGAAEIPFTTFEANTTAKASEVNNNFLSLQSGMNTNSVRINSNDTDIANLQTNKQDRVSASCAIGSSIRVINADGSVVCEYDNDTNTAGIDSNASSTVFPQTIPTDQSVLISRAVTVTAPSAGYIYLSASFQFLTVHTVGVTDSTLRSGIHLDNIQTDISVTSASESFRQINQPITNAISGTYLNSTHTQRVVPVSTAGSYSYYLVANRALAGTTNTAHMYYSSLTAIFIPNLY